ncbi:hypothetical protein [Salicibibacter kimchii]|uniref:Uncharacterized protein n=1 Tax=Salicibibacter kimchii TaxID=2099786 RepID=A0A345BV23_9BACI|nr:hypothetical protein [Salicibibacter kimchii]AXF54804.1 hypothetical protein DT065_01410 [Salicibibacter kimchii]
MQRALRRVDSREGAPIQLTAHLDATAAEEIGFELLDVEAPKNPQLFRQTVRTLGRFDSWQLAAFSDENDLTAPESAVIDDGLAALDEAVTLKGRWNLLKYRFTQPQKLIN